MLAPEFLPVWGGVGTYIVELVRHLPKNIEIHVVTPLREGFGREKVSTLDYDFSRYFGSNVHVHFVSKARDTFLYNASFQYAVAKHVPRLAKEENIDIIHSHTAHMPDLLLRINIPIVTTIHTTIKLQFLAIKQARRKMWEWEKSELMTSLLYPLLRLSEEFYFKAKERFYITPSHWMENVIKETFRVKNIKVIPNCVDLEEVERIRYESERINEIMRRVQNRRVILYAGRLISMKGLDILIESIPLILSSSRDIVFVFAGPGNRSRYIRKIKNMKLEDYCLFVGSLSRYEIIQLMKYAELVVLPSFLENMPFTILEAMACRVPVVATNVGGIPEIIRHRYNGLLVRPGSSKSLSEAIIELLDDRNLRNSIRQRAVEVIRKKFSWSKNIKKYTEVYSSVLNG